MNQDSKVRFGLVGYGMIGSRHAMHIENNPRASLDAIHDTDPNKLAKAEEKHGHIVYKTLDELLHKDLDVISICTPSGFHADMARWAMESGKDVLVEKPMALNLIDADNLIRTERSTGKQVMLVKQNRYNPPIMALKEAVLNDSLGKISTMTCNVLWNRNPMYYKDSNWRGTMRLDGGALMTQCSHFLDLMLWIGGPVRKVYATMTNLNHPYIETEDVGMVNMKFQSGALGNLHYTTNVFEKNYEGTMTVLGSKGTIKVGGEYLNVLEYWNVEDVPPPELPPSKPANDYGSYKGSMSNHDQVIENAVKVILGEAKIAANSYQGRESVEVMQAAYISALYGEAVRLPLSSSKARFKLDEQKPLSGYNKVR